MKLFLTSLFLSPALVFAATSEFPIKGGDQLKIIVNEATVQMTSVKSSQLRIQASDSGADALFFEKKDGVIEIREKEVSDRKDFGKLKGQKRVIEISGPSLPLEIHAFDGQVTINKWSEDVRIHLQKGKVQIREVQGSLEIHSQKGEIQIQNSSGSAQVDTHHAQVQIRDYHGDLRLVNFSGDSTIEKIKGNLDINFNQGTSKILASSGSLDFEMGKGVLNVQGFLGRVEGQSQEGTVSINLAAEQDLSVKTQSGRVVVAPAPNSGSSLSLTTVDGDIYVPNYLKVNRDGAQKYLRARLKGDVQKGHISVRTQEGSIQIK